MPLSADVTARHPRLAQVNLVRVNLVEVDLDEVADVLALAEVAIALAEVVALGLGLADSLVVAPSPPFARCAGGHHNQHASRSAGDASYAVSLWRGRRADAAAIAPPRGEVCLLRFCHRRQPGGIGE
jgi:hypothetical protein